MQSQAVAATKFWEEFQVRRQALEKEIAAINAENITEQTTKVMTQLNELELSVQGAQSFLPPRDQQTYLETIRELKEKVKEQQLRARPKARFRFKSQARKATAITCSQIQQEVSAMPVPVAQPELSADSDAAARPVDNTAGISCQTKKWIRPARLDGGGSGGGEATDLSLTKLEDCVVDLRGLEDRPRALYIFDLVRCIVIGKPFIGATTVRNCNSCVLVLGSSQLRMEKCRDVDVYLYCASHPIIETSTQIRFHDVTTSALDCKEFTAVLEECGLRDLPNQFDKVDDFNWLKRQQSPNWQLSDNKIGSTQWKRFLSLDSTQIDDPTGLILELIHH
ncbi:hypothetical protein EV182_002110 [Spiromyces aspiralis]|uniref:Uncharacterized protein n=1 Tax=Spiromyces aspiralis TaxID=68401 RepID=A0ACC1HI72_9FUNG|nr:hypothetical protein EV182_002110 [Spiromyces aspiralis]